jgi:hypothetical protein
MIEFGERQIRNLEPEAHQFLFLQNVAMRACHRSNSTMSLIIPPLTFVVFQTEERHNPYIIDLSTGRRPDIILPTKARIAGGTACSMAAFN